MGKVLIFFTSNYPYGTGESFIENEIEYLSQAFDKIYLISGNCADKQTREVPYNVTLIRKEFKLSIVDKVLSVLSIFNKIVLNEITQLFRAKKLSGLTFRYLLSSFARGKKVFSFIEQQVSEQVKSGDNVYIYTYWWLDETVGTCLYKNKHPETVVVTRAHGYDLYFFRQPGGYLPFRNFTLQTLDKLYVISKHGIDYLQHHISLCKQLTYKIILSRLGTKQHWDHPHLTINKSFTIISCSYIYPNKRVELIAESLMLVEDIDITWIHIGDFTDWVDTNYKLKVNSLIDKLRQKSNIHLKMMGNLNNADIMNLYKQLKPSLFINVSLYEGIPVSIMEAMSFSIPAIATDVGGTSEIVTNINGYLVEKEVTAQVVAEIITVYCKLNDTDKIQKQQEAFNTWNNTYNAHKNYSTFVNDFLNA